MNGNRFLLDTNAVIFLLKGNAILMNNLHTADWVGISIISQLEFHSFSNLSISDRQLFDQLKSKIEIIGLDSGNTSLIESIIKIRTKYRVKLPDAIIVATSLERNATLITNDSRLQNINVVTTASF